MRVRQPIAASLLAAVLGCNVLLTPPAARAAGASGGSAGSRDVHVEFLAVAFFDGPVGTRISVVQRCAHGQRLNRPATRRGARGSDAGMPTTAPAVALINRELWPAGMVSRYRITRRSPDPGQFVYLGAVCSQTIPAGTIHLRGRSAVDLRVWGPAPAGLPLTSNAAVLELDSRADAVVRPRGVRSDARAMPGGLAQVNQYNFFHEFTGVAALAQTTEAVPTGRFVSMVSDYDYDLLLPAPKR